MTTPDQTPAAAKASGGLYIRLADLIVGGGALFILLVSWAPMVGFSSLSGKNTELDVIGRSLWSWLSPLGLLVIIGVLALIGTAVVDVWWKKDAPLVGLHRHHVQVGLALFVLLDLIGMSFADPYTFPGYGSIGFGPSFGGILMILGGLVAAAGAILNFFNQLQNPIGMPSVSVTAPHTYPSEPVSPTDPTV
jgi:hypothetical protein